MLWILGRLVSISQIYHNPLFLDWRHGQINRLCWFTLDFLFQGMDFVLLSDGTDSNGILTFNRRIVLVGELSSRSVSDSS